MATTITGQCIHRGVALAGRPDDAILGGTRARAEHPGPDPSVCDFTNGSNVPPWAPPVAAAGSPGCRSGAPGPWVAGIRG